MDINTLFDILGAGFAVMAVITLTQTIKRRKALAEVKKHTLGGFKYTDKSQMILLLFCLGLWIFSMVTEGTNTMGDLFTYGFLIAMAILLLSNIIQLTIKPGFYKKGIATGSATLLYNEVEAYEVIEDKKNPDILYVYFNGGAKLFSSVRVVINRSELLEVKKMLKKECTFK